jgi:poly-gamma-glutamate capsule biosynthesis protein CapA/YwtB (metallophosphatase superfamily)
VSFGWPWGDALGMPADIAPDVRVINLETSITTGGEFAPGKAMHYRMSPANVGCVAAARPDACALANNHVLDFGHRGLADTVQALAGAGLRTVGAGPDREAARRPAAGPVRGGRRAVIVACGTASAGIPPGWAAAPGWPGVNLLPDLSPATADDLIRRVHADRQPGDVVVVSMHWGSNWGYGVDADQVRFARRLVDGGVDLVHGHSSHHTRPVEVFRGKLILYGCGDCIDDYEGIRGHQAYRPDLRLLYFASLEADTGQLAALQMAPMQARQMRLHHAPAVDRQWLTAILDRISQGFGSRLDLRPDGMLALRPAPPVPHGLPRHADPRLHE